MEKREEILEAAYQLFAQKGYHASMSDIAKRVNIKVPSIYSHFENKDEIIFLIVEKEINNFFTVVREEMKFSSKVESENRLRLICISICTYFKEIEKIRFWKNIIMIQHIDVRERCRNLLMQQEAEMKSILTEIFIEEGQKGHIKTENMEENVLLFITMMQGVLDEMLVHHKTLSSFEDFTEKIWRAYWEGIRAI